MADGILGNSVGAFGFPKTYVLIDENGTEYTATYVESETIFTATDNDVREGFVYAGDSGVSTGSKTIPNYHTTYGYRFATAGSEVSISVPEFDYSNLFVTITTYDSSVNESLLTTYVAIDNGMYAVGNVTKISDITIDTINEKINLGITVAEKSVVRYLVTREEF